MKKIQMLLVVGLIVGLAGCECDNWKRIAPVAATAPVAAVAPIAQVAPVAQTAPVANDCRETTMRAGTLFVDKIVTKEEIETPKIVVTKKIKTPKIVVKEKITTPKIVADKVETKLFTADKVETKLFVADKTTTKLFEVDKMTVKEAEIEFVKKPRSAGKSAAALKCDSKDCWPRNPTGNYFELGKLGNAILVGNVNNPSYKKENSVSAKMEFHAGAWGPRVIVRNLTTSMETLLSSGLRQEIANHLAKISPYKVGQSGKEGESCFEKTWIVNPATKTWSIRK